MILSHPHPVPSGPHSPRDSSIVATTLEASACEFCLRAKEEGSFDSLDDRIRKVGNNKDINSDSDSQDLGFLCKELEKFETLSRCIAADVQKSGMPPKDGQVDPPSCTAVATIVAKPCTKPTKPKLKSLLKTSKHTTQSPCSIRAHTERRVRGLWNPKCLCLFSRLHDDLFIDHVLPFLSFSDLLHASQVSKRWRYCANHSHCWNRIDVSDSLQNPAVVSHVTRHAADINRLSVRAVEYQLTPHFALMGIGSCTALQELHINAYASLQDSHVNLMLTMKKPHLSVLQLEQCPGLTDLSVKYMTFHCPNLRTLSLRGCSGITNECIQFLKPRLLTASPVYTLVKKPISLTSMFSPLHIPPVSSPSRTNHSSSGKLTSIDLSRTKVDPNGVMSLFSSSSLTQYRIKNFKICGSGESWSNLHLRQLPSKIFMEGLLELDISYSNPFLSAGAVTDAGIRALVSGEDNEMALQKVNLSGHAGITGAGIAMLIRSSPQLKYLNLGGCKGILRYLEEFTTELWNMSCLTHLLLWRCLGNKKQPVSEDMSSMVFDFITAICDGPSGLVLEELDLEGCYLVDCEMVELLNKKCINIRTDGLRLRGTKFLEMKNYKPKNPGFTDIELD